MSPDKEKTIFERWPYWFRDKENVRVSLMSRGFTHGDGWYEIIYQLCERLEPLVAALDDGGAAFQVLQVKEKFGALRFYTDGSNDEIEAEIDAASELSVKTCEVCGNPGNNEADETGWWKTLCVACRTSGQPHR